MYTQGLDQQDKRASGATGLAETEAQLEAFQARIDAEVRWC